MANKFSEFGFERAGTGGPKSLTICSGGQDKSGKTDFALSMPEPLVYLNIGDKQDTDQIIQARYPDKDIYLKTHAFIFKADIVPNFPGDPKVVKEKKKAWKEGIANENREAAQDIWSDTQKSLEFVLKERDVRSLVVDTGTQLWQLCQAAEFGKLTEIPPLTRVNVNLIFHGIFQKFDMRGDINVCVIHRVKEKWARKPGGNDQQYPTGKFEVSGHKEMPYMMQVNLENTYDVEDEAFGVKIRNSSVGGTDLWGVDYWGYSFFDLAMEIYPNSDPATWM